MQDDVINRCKDQLKSRWHKKRVTWNEYQEETKVLMGDATANMEGDLDEREVHFLSPYETSQESLCNPYSVCV